MVHVRIPAEMRDLNFSETSKLLFNVNEEVFRPKKKRPGRKADRVPPSRANVKNEWSYTSTPPICLHGMHRDNIISTFSIILKPTPCGGKRWHICLRHCATSRKFAGSILDGVTGIFH